MRATVVLAVLASAGLLSAGGARLRADPQSLGDLARQEEARRKEVKTPAKVITNKELGSVPASTGAPPPAETPKAPPAADDAAKPADKDKAASPVKDQAYWAGRKKDLDTQLDRDQTYAEALQTRINSLTTDFTARDDPAQRGVIERDRQKALAELDRLKKAIVTDKKAIADLEEEARRARVPPGWLR